MTRLLAALLIMNACTRPADQRALAELEVGSAALRDVELQVAGGLAAVRKLTDHEIELWSQSPVVEVQLALGASAAGDWTITVRNVLPDATLSTASAVYTRAYGDRPTVATFLLTLGEGTHVLRVAPPDADRVEPFRVAAMADIQTALPIVDDVFNAINLVPDARFVVGMGDLTERSELEEYDLYERQLTVLGIPLYTTLGNHELWAEPARFFDRFGRASFQFTFKGAAFTFVDSGDAGLDPIVEEWLDGWLADARDQTHVFLTHIPPIDPLGVRYGAFRSARDGHRLLSRLAANDVELTLYGHIHTYQAFENAGIPAYISGGGGAQPMRFDGIDRHFLMVELDPVAGKVGEVTVHRVPDR